MNRVGGGRGWGWVSPVKRAASAAVAVMLFGGLSACAETPTETGQSSRPDTASATRTDMIITYDNNTYDSRLRTDHGFSCVIRQPDRTILFDTGANGTILLGNMEKLDIDPREIDMVVLSHIHGDHVGGLGSFLERNNAVMVYMPVSFPEDIKGEVRRCGAELTEVRQTQEIAPGVYTTGELGRDIIEQSLVLTTAEGLVVVTGCAHPGVVNVVRKAIEMAPDQGVHLVMGGFHLQGASADQIASSIDSFEDLGVEKVGPCHCSGDRARRMFKERYGHNYVEVGVGKIVPLP